MRSALNGRLVGRVAIVTGAGRGLGRAHALHLAAQGAAVVVNDIGVDVHGSIAPTNPAEDVVAEIVNSGGRAIASAHDVADWAQAADLVRFAVESFGDLHVLVNNAGIVRDRTLANMNEDDWDAVIRVNLKGHAAPSRHALAYWRDRSKAGEYVAASVIHTTSTSGLAPNYGQANYGAAKLAVCALSNVIAIEGAAYGVRSNVISPAARSRMAATVTGGADRRAAPSEGFDEWDPGNVSPVVAWLAEAGCSANRQVLHVRGELILVVTMPHPVTELWTQGRWTADDLDRRLAAALAAPVDIGAFRLQRTRDER